MSMVVQRIARIGLTVAHIGSARDFYQRALGFAFVSSDRLAPDRVAQRFGLRDTRAEIALLRLGQQALELVAFDPPGRPYAGPAAANDPWFQHFAIAVSDMPWAYAHLAAYGGAAISAGGPQQLPPSTGSVTAYKFRDPEGHPLELSYIPGSSWTTAARTDGPFLGMDHTAIAVADLEASLAFYVGALGMRVAARLVNSGPEQDRLDGLAGVALDIAVLEPNGADGPHLELLSYRAPQPARGPRRWRVNDIAATRTVLEADLSGSGHAQAIERSSTPLVEGADLAAPSRIRRDPDGHLIELVEGCGAGRSADPAASG